MQIPMKTLGRKQIDIRNIDRMCDIQVDAKSGHIVMILANAKGRKAVDELWPDVRWSTDKKFASRHSSDWLFTHVRVVKLPTHLEQTVMLALCEPDALGFAVAIALQHRAEPQRVVHYFDEGESLKIHIYTKSEHDPGNGLLVEYVAPGTVIRTPLSGTA